jgi:membrane protein DedA with SNARE-associated domain
MMKESVVLIQSLLSSYGVWAFFFLGVFEEVAFVIPSGLLFLAMGFFGIATLSSPTRAAFLAFGPGALMGALGVTLGAFFMYGAAYWGGRPLIERFGKYVGIQWGEVERIQRFFERGYADEVVLVVLRAIPLFPISVVSVLCGTARVRMGVFAATTFLGTFFRIGILSFAGWAVGREFMMYAEKIAIAEQVFVVLAVTGLVAFLVMRRKKKRRMASEHQ